jgi:hypothetical protein
MPIANPELVQLALQRLRRLLPDRESGPPSYLPAELSSFIGRERELAEVRSLVERARVLSLTGMGGVGKTRLARRIAADIASGYADGVWLIELGSLRDPAFGTAGGIRHPGLRSWSWPRQRPLMWLGESPARRTACRRASPAER